MLDMIAFYEIRAAVVFPAIAPTAGLADQHVTVIGDVMIVPQQCNKIYGVYWGVALTALAVPTMSAILSSPSLRASTLIELSNIDAQVTGAAVEYPGFNSLPLGSIIPYNDFKEAPIQLTPGEGLMALSGTNAASAVETNRVFVFLTDGNISAMPAGVRIESVIADLVGVAVPLVWDPHALVFRQVLRAGTYAIVGMRASGESMTAMRLVLGNQGARPGVIANSGGAASNGALTQPDFAHGLFRYGRSGIWGTFTHTNPPTVEVFTQAADAAADMHVTLDVIKIA